MLEDALKMIIDSSREFVEKAKENGLPCETYVSSGDHFSSVPESMRQCIVEFNRL